MSSEPSKTVNPLFTPGLATYNGSCHCGNVKFTCKIDWSITSTGKCNCSICAKCRQWGVSVPAENFTHCSPPSSHSLYQFGSKSYHHAFCKGCGVRPFILSNKPTDPVFVYVTCFDGLTPEQLASLPPNK
eukprot:gene16899-20095_t